MPEQLAKHPEVTLQVLRSAGAQCGTGAPPAILTACPAERLCKLPGGEICVYGLADASRMTQITQSDWQALVQAAPAPGGAADAGSAPSESAGLALAFGIGLLLLGVVIGWMLRRGR